MRYVGPGLDLRDTKLLNVLSGVAADDGANVSQVGGSGSYTIDGGSASSTYAGGGDITVDGGPA